MHFGINHNCCILISTPDLEWERSYFNVDSLTYLVIVYMVNVFKDYLSSDFILEDVNFYIPTNHQFKNIGFIYLILTNFVPFYLQLYSKLNLFRIVFTMSIFIQAIFFMYFYNLFSTMVHLLSNLDEIL